LISLGPPDLCNARGIPAVLSSRQYRAARCLMPAAPLLPERLISALVIILVQLTLAGMMVAMALIH
jgi:hypothetical protein